jgi:hypothetical protein
MAQCCLCHDEVDPEHPLSVYGRNPETFRKGWMHWYCFNNAFEELKHQPASSPDCMNRLDEYLTHWIDLV